MNGGVHYHVPLHSPPGNRLNNTSDHVNETLDWLAENPQACKHLEMETYTWEVLPENLRSLDVVEQVTNEYHWTLDALSFQRTWKMSSLFWMDGTVTGPTSDGMDNVLLHGPLTPEQVHRSAGCQNGQR